MTENNDDLKSFLRSSALVGGFYGVIAVIAIYCFAKYYFCGEMTFVIKNDTKSDIANIHVTTDGLDKQTGRLTPGDIRTYKFGLIDDSAADLDITFNPDKHIKIANFGYFDGLESTCTFSVQEDALKVHVENTVSVVNGKTEKKELKTEIRDESIPYVNPTQSD